MTHTTIPAQELRPGDLMRVNKSTNYVIVGQDAKDVAAAVRANIKRAQKDGILDSKWRISVRTDRASLCSSVDVRMQGDDLTEEWLFRPRGDGGVQWSDQAVKLAGQVRELMGPAWDWEDGRMRFAFLYFRDGLCAP